MLLGDVAVVVSPKSQTTWVILVDGTAAPSTIAEATQTLIFVDGVLQLIATIGGDGAGPTVIVRVPVAVRPVATCVTRALIVFTPTLP